jgi:hypothetical protein
MPDASKRLNAIFSECVGIIGEQFETIAERYAERTRIEAKVLSDAKKSGRIRFQYTAASDPDTQKTIQEASQILVRQGVLARPADSTFFAS